MSHMQIVSTGVIMLFVYHLSSSGRECEKEVVNEHESVGESDSDEHGCSNEEFVEIRKATMGGRKRL